ncbi:hypothetical protein BZG36_05603 [Bifiguratus adelaidae]|uniref:Isochorismatase-like domain-containing protein n=1 Tax=Bifiguratus adelaidae TaxID=1938954 RepID=A0A261XTK3_9FUNG|nr:hypothetical protein BZG36_05603 [Bifiguratus adelaidae]
MVEQQYPITYGTSNNCWLQYPDYVDISRGASSTLYLKAEHQPLLLDPKRSALIVIDMQNFFLSEELGRGPQGRAILNSVAAAVEHARKVGIRVIWVNWGVRSDVANLPASLLRHFDRLNTSMSFGKELPNGRGKVLEAGSWSAALHPPLNAEPEDIWIHKHRISGFVGTDLEAILKAQGIYSLIFTGVNTEQCVLSTLLDGHNNGYDTILLTDGTATTSPQFIYDSVIYTVRRANGFVTDTNSWLNMEKKEIDKNEQM